MLNDSTACCLVNQRRVAKCQEMERWRSSPTVVAAVSAANSISGRQGDSQMLPSLRLQSTATTGSRPGMQRLTQFVTTSFSESRTGRHDQSPRSATSSWPHSLDVATCSPRRLLMSSRDAVDHHSSTEEELRRRERDVVAIKGFSTGSGASDDTRVASEGDYFRCKLSAFTSGRLIQSAVYLQQR